MQYGFGSVTYAMLDAGLLDEVRLWVHPFLVRGGGAQDLLFREGAAPAMFSLVDATPLDSGIVILTYTFRG
ncbi:hypothetical protein ACWDWO_18265 [Actinopolymorpha singaporensis]|uniref:hypothetical protein n=1 Tax=Actinopolymorpha singaporensis TaxID=117157 RepID=UPI000B87FD06|nr:hypothetical protein [Actinopolymorpha singaporensis]